VNARRVAAGLPLLKPPYGRITAINLDRGEFVWQVAHGETPDSRAQSSGPEGADDSAHGQSGAVGALVTKTLVIAVTRSRRRPVRPRGAMLRAYDKATGKEVGTIYIPAQQSGTR
jgi:quinoprotein glucose dehydrogenase